MANRIVWKFRDLADNHIVQVPYADNGDGTYTPMVAIMSDVSGATPYNTAANTVGYQVKAGAGVLRSVAVNTVGVGSTATLYDGVSVAGTKLGTINTAALANPQYNIAFATGLFIVLAGATPADVTVSYQ